jgi:hypothetical protein
MTPHKHKDVIIAWANGAVIQCKWCEAAPWSNVKNNAPLWSEDMEYRASLAEVEDRPVFEGDALYRSDGLRFLADPYGMERCDPSKLSWNPPKPKTITVTIPRPTGTGGWSTMTNLYFSVPSDATKAEEIILDALK